MPVWNRADLIGESVQSLLNQSFDDWELVVVDDASTDNSGDAALTAADGDPRIRVLTRDSNGGPSVARNEAFREARGEWVAFLDSDDVWAVTKLAEFVARADTYERETGKRPDVIYSWYRTTIDGNEHWTNECSAEGDVREGILQRFFGIPSALMVRREQLLAVGPMEHRWRGNEDYDLLIRLSRTSEFAVVPKALTTVRLQSAKFHMSRNPDSYMALIKKWRTEMLKAGGKKHLSQIYIRAGRMYLKTGQRVKGMRCALHAMILTPSSRTLRFAAVSLLK